MKVALDANCFIDAVRLGAHTQTALQSILSASHSGNIQVLVSRHTLAELSRKPDDAYDLAKTCNILPYWPIGSIGEQVATIEKLAGTWEDARRNEEIQCELEQLAKSGNDIRDRGAYVDALLGGTDVFLTSDRHLAASGPAKRIQERFGLRVLTPEDFVREIAGRIPL